MKITKKILLVLFALLLTLLDVSFFSALPLFGATILSLFSFVLIFAILTDFSNSLIFSISAVIFFAIFSSLPTLLILFAFFVIPQGILYLLKTFFPEPTILVSAIIFVAANLIFEFLMLLLFGQFNADGFLTLGYFVVLNTIFSIVFYCIVKKIQQKINISEVKFE